MASLANQAITDDGEGILQCDGQVCKDFVTAESGRWGKLAREP